jgi:hypothetical protein
VNLRAGPGTVYPLVAQSLPAGTVLTPLARNPAGSWLSVQIQGTSRGGWVIANAALVTCNIPVAELPLGVVPPTPRPRPTATAAPAPTTTPTLPPTDTPLPPTDTPLPPPTDTPVRLPPTPTDTPLPPTATLTPTDTPVVPGAFAGRRP